MSDATKTKAVNLTEDEINILIVSHGQKLCNVAEIDMRTERINYLNRRLKTFKEPEINADTDAIKAHNSEKPENAAGWGTENG